MNEQQQPTDPVKELMAAYQKARTEVAVHEKLVKTQKLIMKGIESALRDHMILNGLQQVSVKGLFSCSLRSGVRYEDRGGFIPWALSSGHTECLTISLKQSGVKEYFDSTHELPAGVVPVDFTTVALTVKK